MQIDTNSFHSEYRRRHLELCIVFGFIILFFTGFAAKAETSEKRIDGFKFSFEQADTVFVEHVIQIIRDITPKLEATLGQPQRDTIHIHIAPTQKAFLTYTPGSIPDWGEGYAVPDRKLVVLKSPRIKGNYGKIHEIVIHEICHVMLHNSLRGIYIPRWLDEGFAMHMAREWGFWDRAGLLIAVVSGNLIPLGTIQDVNNFPEHKAQLAYQESALAVQYLITKYGEERLHLLFDRLRVSGSIEKATLDALGISIVEFERNWLEYMERTYGWRMIFGNSFSIIITPLFGILCLLAYVKIRRRKKITLRRWAKEENYYESKEDRWRRLNEEHVMLKEREE